MYQIENLNEDKYSDVAKVFIENQDDLDQAVIAVKDTKVKVPKHLLLLSSSFMRDILSSYPPSIDPTFIIPDELRAEAVVKVFEILMANEKKDRMAEMDEEVRTDINTLLQLMNIDQNLYIDTIKINNGAQDQQTKVKEESFEDDLDEIIKEEGEDEFLKNAMDEMEQILESETTLDNTDIKQESINEKSDDTESSGQQKKFKCQLCDKRFNSSSSCSRHKRINHKGGVKQAKPVQAQIVDATNESTTDNQEVQKSQDVVKTMVCQICRQSSKGMGGLWEHYKAIHFSKPAAEDHHTITDGLVCKKCKNLFDEENFLFMHIGVCYGFL